MTSITDRPSRVSGATSTAARRPGLLVAVWILAIAVVGLAGWIIYDQVSGADTATSSEIDALLSDYTDAWNDYDGTRFLELVTNEFEFQQAGRSANTAERQAVLLEGGSSIEWAVEAVGEPIMRGEGPWYVAQANVITTTITPADGYQGLSVFTIVEENGALLIRRHVYFGRT